MSKKLEALKELKHWKETNNENGVVWLPLFAVEDIEKALLELKAIKEAKPSEAVECILDIKSNYKFYAHNNRAIDYQCSVIVQSLLKSQKQEKVLEIIKEKCVDIYLLKSISTLEEYNKNIGLRGIELIEKEFNLLKRYFNER